jgi:hypothetical protein
MDTTIQDDFNDFVINESLFNCEVSLYDEKEGELLFEGFGIYDKKPMAVENENGEIVYQGHKSLLTLTLKSLTFMTVYSSLKGHYVEVTDNLGLKAYLIANSVFDSNVNLIMCELKETTIPTPIVP